MTVSISIDRGGTFTDVFAEIDEKEVVFKLLSEDPLNYNDAATEGIRRVLQLARNTRIPKNKPLAIGDVSSIRMGTTVATNGLLERKGDRVALLVTKGYKDILRLGQQARPNIFDLKVTKMSQLYEEVIEVDERVVVGKGDDNIERSIIGVSGDPIIVRKKPNLDIINRELKRIYEKGIQSLAISFLHSYTYPKHELDVADIAKSVGFHHISISSQLQRAIKYVSRANSATADAYLSPIINRYLLALADGFEGGLEALGSKLLFMQSDGGLVSARKFSGLKAILSGPAGGVVGYAKTTYKGDKPVLGFDMGGTSTDVSRYDGKYDHVFETTTAQVVVQAPQLAIETVAAGGGSILVWRNGLYAVGPESAGSHPGPACYRKGGPLTVTDANLYLGRIDISTFPRIFGRNKDEGLDYDTVATKFEQLANVISKDTGNKVTPEIVAQGFLDVANETMCRPIRTLTEGKGFDTSSHTLACFGGAGGQHAGAIARHLNLSEVVIHKYSSLLSAYGIALADIVADVQKPVSITLSPISILDLQNRLEELKRESIDILRSQELKFDDTTQIEIQRFLNCRYTGSNCSMMIKQTSNSGGFEEFSDQFVARHKQEFGFTLERDIIVGDVRVRAIYKTKSDRKNLLPDQQKVFKDLVPQSRGQQKVFFETEYLDTALYDLQELSKGASIVGPAMILDSTQTIVVEPDITAFILDNHIILQLSSSKENLKSYIARTEMDTIEIDSIRLSVFGHRFMSIAEQMGQTLQKTSISVNIKERLDFSCAIFDPDGGLVANAPHIPVHLGSMSSAVRYQRELWEGKLEDGDVIVANHPAYGGSHLPDITVVTPVFQPGTNEIIFWTASRGHHSDIGGITAGSMPPFSNYLWQEGACIKGHKVVSRNQFDNDGIVRLLAEEPAKYPGCSGSRSLNDSISDLKAQISANNKGIQLIRALADEYSLKVVQKYMLAIQNNAELSVRTLMCNIASKVGEPYHLNAEDRLDDGSKLKLAISIDPIDGSTVFDFEGTGPQVFGNLNAPKSITHSAILYCLRTMISEDIPLNQGCLTPLQIKIPEGSFLAPGPEAATVGGNVETSQRITDVVYQVFGVLANSQGTCNNLTFGCDTFGYYETIGGGAGAGSGFHGQSGVQIHMTNTRSTDPEILEYQYPVILNEFAIRSNSGGIGKWRGGDGIIRDIEFRCPVQLSILSERRSLAPRGIYGGHDAEPGQNLWISADGAVVRSLGGKNTVGISTGDRVIIKTPGGGGYGTPVNS